MFIATDHGAHPPDKIAKAAADQIGALLVIDEQSVSADAVTARKQKPRLLLDLADAIEPYVGDAQTRERDLLDEHGTPHLSAPLLHGHDGDTIDLAVEAAVAAGGLTIFEAAMEGEQGRKAIRAIIGSWVNTAAHIERGWAADGCVIGPDHRPSPRSDHDPQCPHVRAFNRARGKE